MMYSHGLCPIAHLCSALCSRKESTAAGCQHGNNVHFATGSREELCENATRMKNHLGSWGYWSAALQPNIAFPVVGFGRLWRPR